MNPSDKTRKELPAELMELRGRIAESEALRIACEKREEERQESEARFQAMIEAFDGFIYVCSPDYEVEFMNERLIQLTGHRQIGEKCHKAVYGLEEVCPWCVNEAVQRGETVRWEVQHPKDNRWYRMVNTPVKHRNGSVSKMAMIQDVTRRKQAEEDLRDSEQLLRSIVSASPVGIGLTRQREIIWVNDVWVRLFGFEDESECKGQLARCAARIRIFTMLRSLTHINRK